MSHVFPLLKRDTDQLSFAVARVRGRPGHDDRPALPAGHPVSWGLLTDGTVLENSEYPYPVFSD